MLMSNELSDVVNLLLPGFVTAWIFHALTPHPKESQFERIVQGFVFTGVIQFVFGAFQSVLVDSYPLIWTWTNQSRVPVVYSLAIVFGLLFAWLANSDWFHAVLRYLRLTAKSGYPSVWYRALYQKTAYATLHLNDGRRLTGWLEQYPSKVTDGHFVMANPSWLQFDAKTNEVKKLEINFVESLMIGADKVYWIEFQTTVPPTNKSPLKDIGNAEITPSTTTA